MKNHKKYKKSSYKGHIGAYSLDARVFKSAKQRERVKKNLETAEGCKRLLNNSNPIYWFLVMAEAWEGQGDYRWTHTNSFFKNAAFLKKPLKHRIIHTLRLDDKKYYHDKLNAIRLMHSCDLYHPKFLKDYIEFFYSMDAETNRSLLKHIKYDDITEGIELLLHVIIEIIDNWDKKYEYPEELISFSSWIEINIEKYKEGAYKLLTSIKERIY